MNRSWYILILVIAGLVFFWQCFITHHQRPSYLVVPPQTLPAPALKIISAGHSEAMAQNIFYKTVFYNEFRAEKNSLAPDRLTSFRLLATASDLDPYNMDCYYYGQALFGDDPRLVRPFNVMLSRGMQYRTWDHYLPWFLGVNYYFTLQDKKMAGKYFFATAKLRPNKKLYATLAARSLHQANETEMAVMVLREMLEQTSSPVVEDVVKRRLVAFETVLFLQNILQKFEERTGKKAGKLQDLVEKGILKSIPPDPYGGSFYLDDKGAVQTTSKFSTSK